jgi:hypothetical protein
MTAVEGAPERYFYHSFPRKWRETDAEIEKGCTILSIIRDSGLIMAPEIVEWRYEYLDGSPARTAEVLQRRISFTELPPEEVAGHAKKFGRFALEFEVPVLKALGAIPVFYIPQALSMAKGAEGAASTLVMQFLDGMSLVERIASIQEELARTGQTSGSLRRTYGFQHKRDFEFDVAATKRLLDALMHALTPSPRLRDGMRGTANFFFGADDLKHDEALGYYREREWRIAGAMTLRNEDIVFSPTDRLVGRLLALDTDFFGREYPAGEGKNRAEQSYVMPGLDGRPIIDMIRRVIVPEAGLDSATAVFKGFPKPPAIVTLESLGKLKV